MRGRKHLKEKTYEEFCKEFIDISDKLGRPLRVVEITSYGLPTSRWYISNCPDESVANYNQFLSYLGLKPRYEISKEYTIDAILKKYEELKRPLKMSDFANPIGDEIGISTIKNHWGNLNKMKEDLNLPITQENMMDKQKTIEVLKNDIIKMCKYIKESEGRMIINLREDVKCYDWCSSLGTYQKIFKKELGMTLGEFIKTIGFIPTDSGRGMNYTFEDGEITTSKYEFLFSTNLRRCSLVYGESYLRDVPYGDFIKEYNGRMNCDYVINYCNKITYIEIAGMLKDCQNTYKNKPIKNSTKKEEYRLKLLEKERMLIENGFEYKILFPNDFNDGNNISIINELFNNGRYNLINVSDNDMGQLINYNSIKRSYVKEGIWDINYNHLLKFYEENGHCDCKELVGWIYKQRENVKRDNLSYEKKEKLKEINFIFDLYEYKWEQNYNSLKQYKQKYGNCLVPQHKREFSGLAAWVSNQRARYNKGKLLNNKIDKLNNIGFNWEPIKNIEDNWEENYKELINYLNTFGDVNVPIRYKVNGLRLGEWTNTQRRACRRGRMCKERVKKLEDLGFIWNNWDKSWEEMFDELINYKEKHGSFSIPREKQYNKLSGWVGTQRKKYKNGSLPQDKINKLDSIGFLWDMKEEQWEEMNQLLREYKRINGNCLVPQGYKENPSLGKWVNRQRLEYRNGKLAKHRYQKLVVIDFTWDVKRCL